MASQPAFHHAPAETRWLCHSWPGFFIHVHWKMGPNFSKISTNPIITIKNCHKIYPIILWFEDPYPTPRHRKIFQLQLESLEGLVSCCTLHTLHATSIKSHRSTSYYLHIIIYLLYCVCICMYIRLKRNTSYYLLIYLLYCVCICMYIWLKRNLCEANSGYKFLTIYFMILRITDMIPGFPNCQYFPLEFHTLSWGCSWHSKNHKAGAEPLGSLKDDLHQSPGWGLSPQCFLNSALHKSKWWIQHEFDRQRAYQSGGLMINQSCIGMFV